MKRSAWALALVLVLSTGSAAAQDSAMYGADTPRDVMASFLELTRAGRYRDAARLFDPAFPAASGEATARRLRAVLDRRLWVALATLSRMPGGAPDDNLPTDVDQVGTLPGPSGPEPLLLRRMGPNGGGRWVIAQSSLDRVDAWYGKLPDRWLREHLPSWLFRAGPRDLFTWQWLALPLLVIAAWLAAWLVAWPIRFALRRLLKRTQIQWDDLLLELLYAPGLFLLALLLIYVALPALLLVAPAVAFVKGLLRVGVLIGVFFSLIRIVEVAFREITRSEWLRQHPEVMGLLPFLSRAAKVLLVLMGVVTALQQMGYAITGLIAGLGIGGLALALAAQKTFENLIGSMALSVDQPFRQGDLVKIDDLVGTVEAVGLRSTRVRTPERTVVTLPNGKLADARIENFSLRERFRLNLVLGLTTDTPPAKVTAILDAIIARLREAEGAIPESCEARFVKINVSSLDVEVNAYFVLPGVGRFAELRQELLLALLSIIASHGAHLAHPTRTVELRGGVQKAA